MPPFALKQRMCPPPTIRHVRVVWQDDEALGVARTDNNPRYHRGMHRVDRSGGRRRPALLTGRRYSRGLRMQTACVQRCDDERDHDGEHLPVVRHLAEALLARVEHVAGSGASGRELCRAAERPRRPKKGASILRGATRAVEELRHPTSWRAEAPGRRAPGGTRGAPRHPVAVARAMAGAIVLSSLFLMASLLLRLGWPRSPSA